MVFSRTKVAAFVVYFLFGLAGCATLQGNGSLSNFSDYAESVFRHQNEISSRLMMLSDSDQLPDSTEFESAEEAMVNACSLLNEYAERESSGESMGLRFKARVQASVEACDASAQRMDTLLKNIGKR